MITKFDKFESTLPGHAAQDKQHEDVIIAKIGKLSEEELVGIGNKLGWDKSLDVTDFVATKLLQQQRSGNFDFVKDVLSKNDNVFERKEIFSASNKGGKLVKLEFTDGKLVLTRKGINNDDVFSYLPYQRDDLSSTLNKLGLKTKDKKKLKELVDDFSEKNGLFVLND